MSDKKKKKEKKRKVGRPRKHHLQTFPKPDMDQAILDALDIRAADGDDEGTRANVWLRQLAEIQYVTSQKFISVEQLHKDPKFKHLSLRIMHKWSSDYHWVDKRREYFERLKVQLERKIGNALVRAQYRQLRDLDELSEQMKSMLRANQVEPKSFEGLTQALLRVEEFRRAERVRLAGDVVNETMGNEGGGGGVSKVVPDLSDDEARHVATEIMKLRQRKIREKLAAKNSVPDEELDEDGEAVE